MKKPFTSFKKLAIKRTPSKSVERESANTKISENKNTKSKIFPMNVTEQPLLTFLQSSSNLKNKLSNFGSKTFNQKENDVLKPHLFNQENRSRSPVRQTRGNTPSKKDSQIEQKAQLFKQLKQNQKDYKGTFSQFSEFFTINDYCLNHPKKQSEFQIRMLPTDSRQIGICSSCAVKYATLQFEVVELEEKKERNSKTSTMDQIQTKLEKLEKTQRAKEELLKSNKSSLNRNFETQKKKLDKLFEFIFGFLEKKKMLFEEGLRENFQNEKMKLQNNFFKIYQSKQTLNQIKNSLDDFSSCVFNTHHEDNMTDSEMIFEEIIRESEVVYDSVEFINFQHFGDFSIKEIVDKIEHVLNTEIHENKCVELGESKINLEGNEHIENGEEYCDHENTEENGDVLEMKYENMFQEKIEIEADPDAFENEQKTKIDEIQNEFLNI